MSGKRHKIAALLSQWENRGADPHLVGYVDCFNRGLYYEAHDVLEHLWLTDRHGPGGAFFKGLIQLAGAFVHLQKNRLRPSAALFKLADANLKPYPRRHERLDVGELQNLIARWLRELEGGGFNLNPLASMAPPKIEFPAEC